MSVLCLGGVRVAGPCTVDEIVRRFGPCDYRITAFGFEPPDLRWECIVEELSNGGSAG